MKILWWAPGFPPDIGGIEHLSGRVVSELARRGVDVVVLANTDDMEASECEFHGVPVVRIPSRRALATRDLALVAESKRQIIEVKHRFDPDIVHVHLADPSVLLHLSTTTPGARTVVTVHNDHASYRAEPVSDSLFDRALASADAVTGVTASVLPSELMNAGERDGRIVRVVPNGIVVGPEPLPVPAGPPVLLAVGRLVDAKGLDVAIRGFARSGACRHDAELRIVGDGPERDALERLATSLGVDVAFTGALAPAAVAEQYAQASLVVMPSRREGQPLVAMEAAAAGRPVLGSRIPGIADVVVDGSTGVLVRVDDPDAFARALDSLLAAENCLQRMGTAARRRAVAEYSIDVCVDRYLALYQTVLDQRGPR